MEKVYEILVVNKSFDLFGIKTISTYLYKDRDNATKKVMKLYQSLINANGFDYSSLYINGNCAMELECNDKWWQYLLDGVGDIPNDYLQFEYKDYLDSENVVATEVIYRENIIREVE